MFLNLKGEITIEYSKKIQNLLLSSISKKQRCIQYPFKYLRWLLLRGVFRTQSNISDGAFCGNSQRLNAESSIFMMFDQLLTGFDFSFNHLVKYFFILFYKFYFFQYSKTIFKFCCTRLDFNFYSSEYLRKNIHKHANFSLSPRQNNGV